MIRIFQATALKINTEFKLDRTSSHHLASVLRCKVGQLICLFNGEEELEFNATIIAIERKQVSVHIDQRAGSSRESPLNIHLAQALSRTEKMDWVIQKAVELGVNKITPIITERCNVRIDQKRLEKKMLHWQQVIISACEQCGRNLLPKIEPPIAFEQWITESGDNLKIILNPKTNNKLENLPRSAKAVTILIGPEGGLSPQEISLTEHYDF